MVLEAHLRGKHFNSGRSRITLFNPQNSVRETKWLPRAPTPSAGAGTSSRWGGIDQFYPVAYRYGRLPCEVNQTTYVRADYDLRFMLLQVPQLVTEQLLRQRWLQQ